MAPPEHAPGDQINERCREGLRMKYLAAKAKAPAGADVKVYGRRTVLEAQGASLISTTTSMLSLTAHPPCSAYVMNVRYHSVVS